MSVALARLSSQLLVEGREPNGVVSHFGALQGQDLPGVIASMALRATGDRQDVIEAFNAGEIVRTWPQRGTLHVVGADRVRDVLVVARERTWPQTVRRRQQLGIDDDVLDRARETARAAVGSGITRAELVKAWKRAGIATEQGRAYHLIFHLSLEGLLVWGPIKGSEQLLVALDDWVPQAQTARYEDIVADIVTRYVTSHAPTTRKDVGWWANLPLRDVDRAFAASTLIERDGYWWGPENSVPASPRSLHLLPGFDEMLLGYSDRMASLQADHVFDVCPGNNGVFTPTIMLGGRVIGTWKRATREVAFFEQPSRALRKRVAKKLAEVPL
ncbi:winged helix DNA-binding domain-containing protein [Flaviflexus huanghaiensis]|uniref:winged helix DNA-binding domain-containing protein n=1 Tax=Flaviflexus huanghaiensis TaxID=1111473 RepID=UPI0015FCCD74|nr:winged helix DNA-binding domain-containing protein [Flaviflexus huanghaiensis]